MDGILRTVAKAPVKLSQRIAARLDTGRRPGRKSGAGGGDGLLDLRGIGLGVFADHIGQVGRIDIARVIAAGEPLAADVVVVTLVHDPFLAMYGLRRVSRGRPGRAHQ